MWNNPTNHQPENNAKAQLLLTVEYAEVGPQVIRGFYQNNLFHNAATLEPVRETVLAWANFPKPFKPGQPTEEQVDMLHILTGAFISGGDVTVAVERLALTPESWVQLRPHAKNHLNEKALRAVDVEMDVYNFSRDQVMPIKMYYGTAQVEFKTFLQLGLQEKRNATLLPKDRGLCVNPNPNA